MWKAGELVQEAWRNLGVRHLILALTAFLVAGAMTYLSLQAASSAIDQVLERRAAGALVWEATAKEPTGLPGPACHRLNALPGVRAAGGVLVDSQEYRLPSGQRAAVLLVQPPTLNVWNNGPPLTLDKALIGRGYEQVGAASVGTQVLGSAGPLEVVGRLPPEIAHDQLQSSIVMAGLVTEPVHQCWVKMAPGAAASGGNLLEHVFGADATVAPHLRASTGLLEPLQQWQGLAGTRPWLFAGLALGLVGAVVAWTLRSDLAVYRAFGTPMAQCLLLYWLELTFSAIPGSALGTSTALLTWAATQPVHAEALPVALSWSAAAVAIGLGLSTVSVLFTAGGTLSEQLKDR